MQLYPPGTEYKPRAETIAEKTAMLAAMAVVNASVDIHLIDADFAFLPGLTFADLSEASYAGYAADPALLSTFTSVQYEADGSVRVGSTTLSSFAGPSDDVPVTIYGWAMTQTTGTTRLYRLVKFAQPVVLPDDNTFLNIIPTITFRTGVMGQ